MVLGRRSPPRREQTHEVARDQELAVLVHDRHCHDVVVVVDHVHNRTHDTIPLSILDNLAVLSLAAAIPRFVLFLLLLAAVVISPRVNLPSRERTHHEHLSVSFFALGDDKGFCLVFDLFSQLLDQLLDEELFYERIDDVNSHPIPEVVFSVRSDDVKRDQLALKHDDLVLVHDDVHGDQTCLLTLEDVKVQVVLVPKSAHGLSSDTLDAVTRMEQVQVFPALLGNLCRDVSILIDKPLDLVSDVWLRAELDRSEGADTVADDLFRWILLVQVLLSLDVRVLCGLSRLVKHLLGFEILQELTPRECKGHRKLVDAAKFGNLNLISLQWLFLALLRARCRPSHRVNHRGLTRWVDTLFVVTGQVGNQRVEAQQLALELGLR